jgi:hypothetical protein
MQLRLEREMGEVLSWFEDTANPGESLPTALHPQWAKDNNTEQHARMKYENGVRSFVVAPAVIDRTLEYEHKDRGFFDMTRALSSGHAYAVDVSRVMAEIPVPEAILDPVANHAAIIEKRLFQRLVTFHGSFALVNPSHGSLWRARKFRPRVAMTSRDKVWQKDTLRVMAECGWSSPELTSVHDLNEVKYLGANPPERWFPNSVSLVPDPYSELFMEQGMVVDEGAEIKMTYRRKDRVVTSRFEKFPERLRYSPQIVAHNLKTESAFFIEANFYLEGFFFSGAEDTYPIPHRPFFLSRYPDCCDGVRADDRFLYDISSKGTYMSRRCLIVEEARARGLEPAPLVEFGCYEFGVYSTEPVRVSGVTQPAAGMLHFSGESPYKVACGMIQHDRVLVFDSQQDDLQLIDGTYVHVRSRDTPVPPWRSSASWKRPFSPDSVICTRQWETDLGLIPTDWSCGVAILYEPHKEGSVVIPGLGPGNIHKIPVYTFAHQYYVVVPLELWKYGTFIWDSPEVMKRRMAWTTRLGSNWHLYGMRAFVGHDEDYNLQIKKYTTENRYMDTLVEYKIRKWTDPGAPLHLLVRAVAGLGETGVRRLLRKRGDTVLWRTLGQIEEWVLTGSLLLEMTGDRVEGKVDGRTLLELFQQVRSTRKGTMVFGMSQLEAHLVAQLFDANGILVTDIVKYGDDLMLSYQLM